ncbi:chaperone protein ClpB1 [Forsythia ovata]|uniref:Chaperone protein ClpB1 n=1 Tax=Forsythia ovata TaxID=205694 RepID=A0ABD1TTR3_9LAMI
MEREFQLEWALKEVERRHDLARAADLRYELFGKLDASANENGMLEQTLDHIKLWKSRVVGLVIDCFCWTESRSSSRCRGCVEVETSVGKTELAEALAEQLYGDNNMMVRNEGSE